MCNNINNDFYDLANIRVLDYQHSSDRKDHNNNERDRVVSNEHIHAGSKRVLRWWIQVRLQEGVARTDGTQVTQPNKEA